MQWFSAIIPAYPEIQAKAHAELDRVVGRDRLPTIEDEQDLPYVRAIIKVSLNICSNVVIQPILYWATGSRAFPQSFLAWYTTFKHS
jgi:hypothetical protein